MDCTRRVVGCHSTCKEYLEFFRVKDEYVANEKRNKDKDDLYSSYKHDKRYHR